MVTLAAIVAWDTVCLPSPYFTLSLSLFLTIFWFDCGFDLGELEKN